MTLKFQRPPQAAASAHHQHRAVSSPNCKRVRSIALPVQSPPEPEVGRTQGRIRTLIKPGQNSRSSLDANKKDRDSTAGLERTYEYSRRVPSRALGVRNVSTLNSKVSVRDSHRVHRIQFPPEPEGGRELDGFVVRGVKVNYCHARAVSSLPQREHSTRCGGRAVCVLPLRSGGIGRQTDRTRMNFQAANKEGYLMFDVGQSPPRGGESGKPCVVELLHTAVIEI